MIYTRDTLTHPALCRGCGAIVGDQAQHDDWHETQTGINAELLRISREVVASFEAVYVRLRVLEQRPWIPR